MLDRERVQAFRIGRQGLGPQRSATLAEAAACPASDFQRGSALLALAARSVAVTREAYHRAVDSGELVVGPTLRAAIHAVAPAGFALYGRALIAADGKELGEQLGHQAQQHLTEVGIAAPDALEQVADATTAALASHGALTKVELHEELRERVRSELLPWCGGCKSHHVAPMLWRFGVVQAGSRCDSSRHYVLGQPGETPAAAEAARRFLGFYGPSTLKELTTWSGLAVAHARRVWEQIAGELAEVRVDGERRWLLAADEPELQSPPQPAGLRLLPPRDPYLQQPERAELVPDAAVRKRLFRPVGGPGAVLQDGRLVGLWRVRARGKAAELTIEELEPIDRGRVEVEAGRVAELRGSSAAAVVYA